MPLSEITVQGYRSIPNLAFPVEPCGVFIGANGTGKTNLYKSLQTLRRAADGTLTRAIAEEGGLQSVLWAGERRRGEPVRLILKAHFDELNESGAPHTYEVQIGLRQPTEAAFLLEPLIKEERLVVRERGRDVVMMERKGPLVVLRNENGVRETHKNAVLPSEAALSAFRDGARYPELEAVRREMLEWRLYHDFRTDAGSPVRQPCYAITTPTLAPDGHDLAAVLATLAAIRGDTYDLDQSIEDAFPGAKMRAGEDGSHCRFSLAFPDVPRPFSAHELSDGTLKYLCLLGALLGYRLPSLIALNEPESSLHPSLLAPLARLIGKAAGRTRIWIVTHSAELADAIEAETGRPARRVIKNGGATSIEGLTMTRTYRNDD